MDKVVLDAGVQNQYGLITRERAEKFDLLGQLILNQREAIILCGAEWIGKTTLLSNFKKSRGDIWIICLLQGLGALNFEQIQTLLIFKIRQRYPQLADHDLQVMLNFCEQQQQKVVLILDDAVELASGLITSLTEYALHNPVLRLVFTFTRDELYLKSSVDKVLDDCYFIELPALTKPQMAVFLQNLLTSPDLNSAKKIDNKLIAELYSLTGGLPGKITGYLPILADLERKRRFSLLLKSALLLSVMSAIWFHGYKINPHSNWPHLSSPLSLKSIKPVIKQDVRPIINNINVSEHVKLQANSTKMAEVQLNNQDADAEWVLQQAPNKYTLQLMAFSKRESLENIVKKHPNLQAQLKILQITSNNQEKYVLLYGSFAETKTANNTLNSLPSEFKQAWPRQFDTLQIQIKKRAFPHLK